MAPLRRTTHRTGVIYESVWDGRSSLTGRAPDPWLDGRPWDTDGA